MLKSVHLLLDLPLVIYGFLLLLEIFFAGIYKHHSLIYNDLIFSNQLILCTNSSSFPIVS